MVALNLVTILFLAAIVPDNIYCGQLCLSCSESTNPENCQHFVKCDNDQVCFLHMYRTEQHQTKYDTGCTYPEFCRNPSTGTIFGKRSSLHNHILCEKCCNDTLLCNRQNTCQHTTTPQAQTCLSCSGIDDPRKCTHNITCDKNEECYLHKYMTEYHHELYDLGCKQSSFCISGSAHIFGRRMSGGHRMVCERCCGNRSNCNHDLQCSRHPQTHDLCSNNQRCFNGGTCQSDDMSHRCICVDGFLGQNCQYADGKAKDFVVIFYQVLNRKLYTPKLLIAVKDQTNLLLTFFKDGQNKSIAITTSQPEYYLNATVITPGDVLSHAGVNIHSDKAIRLYGFLFHHGLSEGFLSIPTLYTSTHYIIPSFKVYFHTSVFVVASVYPRTTININFKMDTGAVWYNGVLYSNNESLTIVLDTHTTFQVSEGIDLSGTLVTATKPIVVVSGNQCNTINNLNSNCQPFMEMVLPVNQLDHVYIIPAIAQRLVSTVRILAVNDTHITSGNNNDNNSSMISSRDHMDLLHGHISYVTASDDIMVVLYPHETKGEEDPFMMTVPGINQYLYEYDFVAPLFFESYISVTVLSESIHGFTLDNKPLTISTVYNISESSYNYSTFTLTISNGAHSISHNQRTRFGLWVYGYATHDAYGYPGGMAFKTL